MSTTEAKVVLSVVDRITAPLNAIQRRIERITAPVRRIVRTISDVGRAAGLDRISNAVSGIGSRLSSATAHASAFLGRLSAISGISLAGVGIGLKDLWKVNANMETMRMRIGELFGKDRQKEVMDWAVAFDRVNPGGIQDIVENLTKLKAMGIDGTLGTLKSITDYNSKVGGSQEKLKRIILALGQMQTKGKIQGDEVLQLTEAGVPAMQLLARATGKTQDQLEKLRGKGKLGVEYIRALVTQMGKESDGAGEAYMKTAEGIIDKLQSTIQGFKLKIGDAGAFDFMKQKLDQFADWVNSLPADQVAKRISDGIVTAGREIEAAVRSIDIGKALDQFERGWQVAKEFGASLKWLSDIVGGPVNLALGALAVFTLAPLAASALSAVAAIVQLSAVLLATPVGAFLLAVGAIAGAAALIYANWEPIKKLFDDIWTKFTATPGGSAFATVNKTFYDAGVAMVDSLWNGLQSTFPRLVAGMRAQLAALTSWMPKWATDALGLSDVGRSGPTSGAGGSWDAPKPPEMPGRSVAPLRPQSDWGGRAPSPFASTATPPASGAGDWGGRMPSTGVQPVQAATPSTNVEVDANAAVTLNVNWSNLESVLSQVRALITATEARQRAAVAAALGD